MKNSDVNSREITKPEAQHALDIYTYCGNNYSQASKELRMNRKKLVRRVKKAEEWGLIPNDDITKKFVNVDGKIKEVPLSENIKKIQHATKEECIEELRKIAKADPDKFITRNFFRGNSHLAESAWTKHFGTFQEFKAQAKITTSRHAKAMERAIAKHASVDEYKKLNEEKAGWEGAYLKPNNKRFKTVIGVADVHDKECDPFYRRVLMDTVGRIDPDAIILNGDIFDLFEFSNYAKDPREWDTVGRIKWVHEFIGDMRKLAPEAELHFIEGNHEYRLLRHLAEATPALRDVLSDLHGLTIPGLLQLDQFEINYISRSDLAAFTRGDFQREVGKNWMTLYDNSVLFSHYPKDRHRGIPGFNGHHHKHEMWTNFSPVYGTYEWHQIGAGHNRYASYCDGEIWANGFMIMHIDTHTKKTQFEYVQIQDHVVVGGKWYNRTEEESLLII